MDGFGSALIRHGMPQIRCRGVMQPSGAPVTFLGQGPSPLIQNSRTVGGPLPPVGPPVTRRSSHPIVTPLVRCLVRTPFRICRVGQKSKLMYSDRYFEG